MKPKSSHTPGPWKIDGGTNKNDDLFIWQDTDKLGGHGIAKIYGEWGDMTGPNARLIAAAPELLLSAKAALLRCSDVAAKIMLEKAIAKAEGR